MAATTAVEGPELPGVLGGDVESTASVILTLLGWFIAIQEHPLYNSHKAVHFTTSSGFQYFYLQFVVTQFERVIRVHYDRRYQVLQGIRVYSFYRLTV